MPRAHMDESKARTRTTPADASRIVVAALAALIALELLSVAWLMQEPLREYRNAKRAATVNKAMDSLLAASVDLSFERGRTRVVLMRREVLGVQDALFIEQRRAGGDAALAAGLAAMPREGVVPLARRIEAVSDSHAAMAAMRPGNDATARLPLAARDPGLAERWFETASRVFRELEALMEEALLDPALAEIGVHDLFEVKVDALRMRDAAGTELSHVAGVIARGAPLSGSERDQILAARERVLVAWDRLRRLAASAPQLKPDIDAVQAKYIEEFGTLRDRILSGAAARTPYPMSVDQYTAQVVSALGTIGKLASTTAAVADERAQARQRHARGAIAIYAVLAVLATALVAWLTRFVYRNFRLPLERLNRTLAGGEIALWDADVASGAIHLSKEWPMMLGDVPHEVNTTVASLKKQIHPQDRKHVLRIARTAVREKVSTYRVEHRVRDAAGRWMWIRSEGRVVELDAKGRAKRISGINIRIHERKQAEEALRRERERYRKLIEKAPDAIFINRDDTISYANPAALRLLGADTASQVVGSSIFRFLHPDDHAAARDNIARRSISRGTVDFFERRYVRLDGTIIDLELSGVEIIDENGFARLIVARDVSHRKRIERERREIRLFLDSLVENIPHMIFVKDAATLRFVRLNRAAEELLGMSREEMLGKTDHDFFPPEQADCFVARDRATLSSTDVVDIPEEPVQTRSRGLRYLHTKKIPIRDIQEEPRYLLGISEDITERKASSEALRASEERLKAVMDHSTAVIALNDTQGRYLMVNHAWAQLFAVPVENAIGKHLRDILPDGLARVVESEHAKVLATGEPSTSERAIATPGGMRSFVCVMFPLCGPDGAAYAVGTMSTDITQRQQDAEAMKHMNEALAEHARELAAANMQLESFSYSVSHDLRAPLRHVRGFAALLEQRCADQLDANAHRYLTQIGNAVDRMTRLIEGLLEFARTGRGPLSRSKIQLTPLVREVVQEMQPQTAGRRIEWTIGTLPEVAGDPRLLRVVFANIIGNAVKYTGNRADAMVEIGSQAESGGEAVVYVRDNGVGFDEQHVEKIFTAFQRLHSERDFEGAGIGLATVKQIVERHGGRVWAESAKGEGATFFVALPAVSVETAGT